MNQYVEKFFLRVKANPKIAKHFERKLSKLNRYTAQALQLLKKRTENNLIYLPKSCQSSVTEIVDYLMKYDVISFDIFDTLLFRKVENPKDVFEIMGLDLDVQLFKKIRVEAERESRVSAKILGNEEINIQDIYTRISQRSGISSLLGITEERQKEELVIYANPFMKKVFTSLIERGKRIVLTSDMYFSSADLKMLLSKNGYEGYSDLFVSCECLVSKATGNLQQLIKQKIDLDNKLSFIHIGDNEISDVRNSRNAGWSVIYYPNVNSLNKSNRIKGMSTVAGSLYNGIVNSQLSNGVWDHNEYYTFGFRYLGILFLGYCEWLNQLARQKNATKILFPARDMYLVSKVYKEFFNEVESDYIYCSRFFSIFSDFSNACEIFVDYLKNYQQKGLSFEKVFCNLGISFLLEEFCNQAEADVTSDLIFEKKHYEMVRRFIYAHKEDIQKFYLNHKEAATRYITDSTKDHKRVLFADTNGRCTSLTAIRHLLKEQDVDVVGSFLYSVSGRGYVETRFANGTLYSYLFSCLNNVDLYKNFSENVELKTDILESIFTAPTNSVRICSLNKSNNVVFDVDVNVLTEKQRYLDDMFQGACLFIKMFKGIYIDQLGYEIQPRDAWLPLREVINSPEINDLFKKYRSTTLLGE